MLKVILKRNKITQRQLAELFSISQRQLTHKLKIGEFTSTELEIMLHILDFGRYHPMDVFFDTISTKQMGLNRWGSKEGRISFHKAGEDFDDSDNAEDDLLIKEGIDPKIKVLRTEITKSG